MCVYIYIYHLFIYRERYIDYIIIHIIISITIRSSSSTTTRPAATRRPWSPSAASRSACGAAIGAKDYTRDHTSKIMLEDATESPLGNATEVPERFLRC